MISAGSLRDVRVPGKVFLMGEYSVIQGGKALVTAIRPGIEYSLDHGQALSVHPESPLGVFQSEQNSILEIKLSSSESSLGLGSSTAELIAAEVFSNGSTEGARSTKALWNWYRNHFPRASGADLAVQYEALRSGAGLFEVENLETVHPLSGGPLLSQLYLFQASESQKLPTHVNLNQVRSVLPLREANLFVDRFRNALEHAGESDLKVLNEWAAYLQSHGLVTDFARSVQLALSRIDGVIGVKGCGAGLNDLFLVAMGGKYSFSEVNQRLAPVLNQFQLRPLGSVEELLWRK